MYNLFVSGWEGQWKGDPCVLDASRCVRHHDQGAVFAGRLREIAKDIGCDWLRLTPPAEDWNDALREQVSEAKKREEEKGLPHARRPPQG